MQITPGFSPIPPLIQSTKCAQRNSRIQPAHHCRVLIEVPGRKPYPTVCRSHQGTALGPPPLIQSTECTQRNSRIQPAASLPGVDSGPRPGTSFFLVPYSGPLRPVPSPHHSSVPLPTLPLPVSPHPGSSGPSTLTPTAPHCGTSPPPVPYRGPLRPFPHAPQSGANPHTPRLIPPHPGPSPPLPSRPHRTTVPPHLRYRTSVPSALPLTAQRSGSTPHTPPVSPNSHRHLSSIPNPTALYRHPSPLPNRTLVPPLMPHP
jgi:hypothetical protein